MVKLHVFSIKIFTLSHMAWSALLVSKCHVSKHTSNRCTKLVPQTERATTAIPLAPQILLSLLEGFCRHSYVGEKRGKSQPHPMQSGWQNFVGVLNVTEEFSGRACPRSTLNYWCIFTLQSENANLPLLRNPKSFLGRSMTSKQSSVLFSKAQSIRICCDFDQFFLCKSISVVTDAL